MKLNKTQREVLNKQFQASFNDKELAESFKQEYNEAYKEWGSKILEQEGFPKYVDVNKGDFFNVNITPKSGTDVFVDYVEDTDEIESGEEFEAVRSDKEFFIEIILKNISATNIELELKATPAEFLEQYPTEEYLAKEMARYYSEKELEHRLKETQELNEEVKQAASEEGFDRKTQIDTRDYRLENITLKQSFDRLSETFLDKGYINESNTVQSFLRNEFYNLIIRNRLINYRIVITRDLEEYDEV